MLNTFTLIKLLNFYYVSVISPLFFLLAPLLISYYPCHIRLYACRKDCGFCLFFHKHSNPNSIHMCIFFNFFIQKLTLNAVCENQSTCFVGLLKVLLTDSMLNLQSQLLRTVESEVQHLTSLPSVQILLKQTWYVFADFLYKL